MAEPQVKTLMRGNEAANGAELAILSLFKSASTALISDNLDRLPASRGIRPFYRGEMMVGRAFTVKTRPGDNLAVHQALEQIGPHDVLVVDGGGDEGRALVGEIIVAILRSRQAAGLVVDGAIRDVGDISAGDFPCFARSAIHAGPYKDGPGTLQVPVNIGGMVVRPGDIVVGDADGVVAFSPEIASQLHAAVVLQIARERELLQSIKDGTYAGAYGEAK